MRWIETEEEINRVLGLAYTCVGVDSGRIPTGLARLVFDELGIESTEFASLISLLITLAAEAEAMHVVLRPDPVYYFHQRLGRYPAFALEAKDSPESYMQALGEKLHRDAIDNLGTFWSECVITSPTQIWFVHAVRTTRENGGHLWIPEEWIQQASDCYRWLVASPTGIAK